MDEAEKIARAKELAEALRPFVDCRAGVVEMAVAQTTLRKYEDKA